MKTLTISQKQDQIDSQIEGIGRNLNFWRSIQETYPKDKQHALDELAKTQARLDDVERRYVEAPQHIASLHATIANLTGQRARLGKDKKFKPKLDKMAVMKQQFEQLKQQLKDAGEPV